MALMCLSALTFAGCSSKQTAAPYQLPHASPLATMPPLVVQVPKEVCGLLTAAEVSAATGIKVGSPAVSTIQSSTGSHRSLCTYAKDGDPSIVVATTTTIYKKETVGTEFQSMLDAQKKSSRTADGIGTEAYYNTTDAQPQLIMVTADAQYWIQMGKLNQSDSTQLDQLKKLGLSLLAK